MTSKLPWFSARLLFECGAPGEVPDGVLFEERVVLIKSDLGIVGAEKQAKKIGRAANLQYPNSDGTTIFWRFKEILDVVQLNEASIGEGSEVYHHYLKADEVEQIRESLKSGSLG